VTAPTIDTRLHGQYTPEPAPPPPLPPAAPAPEPRPWRPATRVAFRFAFAYLALYNFPFLLQFTNSETVSEWYARALWGPVVAWTGAHVLRLPQPVVGTPSGSGDTTYDWVYNLCLLVAAVVATAVWSALDRRRTEYRTLHDRLRVLVRYALGATMFSYGAFKVFKSQFPDPSLDRLLEPYGNFSPMGLAWSFLGFSYAYNLYAGLAEVAGVLLFFRRTTLLGAVVSAAALTNVVMVNFAFDVPVKLYSAHLFAMALFLMLPDARRLANLFLFNRPADAADERRAVTGRRARVARAVVKPLVIAVSLWFPLSMSWEAYQRFQARPRAPLYGIYDVTTFTRNGVAVPPLFTNGTRWRRVVVGGPGFVSLYAGTDSLTRYAMQVDTAARRLTIRTPRDSGLVGTFAYAPAGGGLALRGSFRGDSVSASLRRVDHTRFRLISRGFHWVNEVPFNR
jgi:hypothetical protein